MCFPCVHWSFLCVPNTDDTLNYPSIPSHVPCKCISYILSPRKVYTKKSSSGIHFNTSNVYATRYVQSTILTGATRNSRLTVPMRLKICRILVNQDWTPSQKMKLATGSSMTLSLKSSDGNDQWWVLSRQRSSQRDCFDTGTLSSICVVYVLWPSRNTWLPACHVGLSPILGSTPGPQVWRCSGMH
jgi:hypothetical protein